MASKSDPEAVDQKSIDHLNALRISNKEPKLIVPHEELVFSGPLDGKGDFHYNRGGSTATEELSKKLVELYGLTGDSCLIVPSGMAAINLAVSQCVLDTPKLNIICGKELFAATQPAIKHISQVYGNKANVFQVNVCNNNQIVELFSLPTILRKDNVLFVESASNPSGFMMDWSLIPQLRTLSKTLTVIVDNTWLSCASFNPFLHGANIVVNSLTKYYSGGTAIGGAILAQDAKFVTKVFKQFRMLGMHVSPFNASKISAQIDTLGTRVAAASYTTNLVVQTLHNQKVRIIHPNLAEHPSHLTMMKYVQHMPSVFTVLIAGKKNAIKNKMSDCKLIEHKTSFGAAHHRSDTFPKQRGADTLCRFSVGYLDNSNTLISAVLDILGLNHINHNTIETNLVVKSDEKTQVKTPAVSFEQVV